MIDIRQSENYANYLESLGWIVKRINYVNYFIKKLPIIGGVLKIQRPETINFKTIKNLASKYRVFQIILEPNLGTSIRTTIGKGNSSRIRSIIAEDKPIHNLILSYGFKLSKSPYLPSKTLLIDLNQTRDLIFNNFSKDCRYCIRKGSDITIHESSRPSEIKLFHDAWKKSVKFTRFVPSLKQLLNLKKNFPNNNSIFLTSHNMSGSIIGGAIFTRSGKDFSYYWQAFTNKEGRALLCQYSLVYQGILWGKEMGCKVFDMEGIFDERFPQRSWLGFSHFKKGFGGKEVIYPGCYTKFHLLH